MHDRGRTSSQGGATAHGLRQEVGPGWPGEQLENSAVGWCRISDTLHLGPGGRSAPSGTSRPSLGSPPMPIWQFAQSAPWYWVTQIATPDAERPRSHSVKVNSLKGGPPASACPSNNQASETAPSGTKILQHIRPEVKHLAANSYAQACTNCIDKLAKK